MRAAGVGRLLGVDWGEKRIGLALSDESQILAQPLTTLTRRTGKRFPMHQLIAIVREHAAAGVVVGTGVRDARVASSSPVNDPCSLLTTWKTPMTAPPWPVIGNVRSECVR